MTIEIQYVKIAASDALSDYINEKLSSLSSKYDWIIKAQVYIKKTNDHTGNNCQCEIELSAPGPRIYASEVSANYEIAVKGTIKDLEQQLKKRKQVFSPH